MAEADLILRNARVTTLDTAVPEPRAVAVKDGCIQLVAVPQRCRPS